MSNHNPHYLAVFGLLFGAFCWGVIWYPYRLMHEVGVSGIASSFYTYSITIILGALLFARHWRDVFKLPKDSIYLCLVAGWTNLSYVLAVIDGEVMRVMMLFYLSPLWTLFLAKYWLNEKINLYGYLAIIVSMLGAFMMLWQDGGLPLPQNRSEWLALSSGVGFSLTNVMTRRASHLSIAAKSMLVWVGVASMALFMMPFLGNQFPAPSFFKLNDWLIMFGIAILLFSATLFVQFGVTKMTAASASVLFLFELVVAAIASYYLANERMSWNEWLGGCLIVIAAIVCAIKANHD